MAKRINRARKSKKEAQSKNPLYNKTNISEVKTQTCKVEAKVIKPIVTRFIYNNK